MHLLKFLTVCINLFWIVNCLQCVDESNNNVDWYVLYKIPHIKKGCDNKLIKSGFAYLFISSNNISKWTLSSLSMNDSDSFLARTLEPLYDHQKNDNLTYILYNDEPPKKSGKSSRGHTKGVVLGDHTGGIWLVHSVPLFPPESEETYSYPLTGSIYGQSALCISLDAENMNNVGVQLQYNQPIIYSENMPSEFIAIYPRLNDVINREVVIDPPYFHELALKTLGGTTFRSFAKTKNFLKDLYEDWVAPALDTGMFVETWQNGPGKLPSDCSKTLSIKNVEDIKLDAAKVVFKSTLDHSKWAVSNTTESNWICIGDINRAEHQKHRAGGTVCLNNQKIASAYRDTISTVESCPKSNNH